MIRVAAVADVHMDADLLGRYRPALRDLAGQAEALLLAGDLTRHGTLDEAACVAKEFGDLPVPVIAVLGNHDYHSDLEIAVTQTLADAGLIVLEGSGVVLDTPEGRLGVAGVKGFGGGFAGRCATAFGEREMKAFVGETERCANLLRAALAEIADDCDALVALTHYAPIPETLVGEPLEIYPMLGAFQLGEAIDAVKPRLAIHGHAHYGSPAGTTPGGVPVRNVALPVLGRPYAIFSRRAL